MNEFVERYEDQQSFLEHWRNASQNTDQVQYQLRDQKLKLSTDAGSQQRVKVRFNKKDLSYGQYEWRVYVPAMKLREQCSIGAFLYHDDKHELDFEIGSGKQIDREQLNAKDNELILYCTSQRNPFDSKKVLITSEAWYKLRLQLTPTEKGQYLAQWYVNDKKVHSLQLYYGKRIKFKAYCSLENIAFIGDLPTSEGNYVLFDWFEYSNKER